MQPETPKASNATLAGKANVNPSSETSPMDLSHFNSSSNAFKTFSPL